MLVASLLTLAALVGTTLGVLLGQSGAVSRYMAAAGGGLLLGIALFWLTPEMAGAAGLVPAVLMVAGAAALLAAIDLWLTHAGHSPRQGVLGPLLVATAIHSFVDGWSVRTVTGESIAQVAVPLGLALHKMPEGLAIGWIARRSLSSRLKAAAASAGVELFTLLGAFVEPHATRRGEAAFGSWWTTAMLSFIAGSFVFLGIHAIRPAGRERLVWLVFAIVLGTTAALRAFGLPVI